MLGIQLQGGHKVLAFMELSCLLKEEKIKEEYANKHKIIADYNKCYKENNQSTRMEVNRAINLLLY